MRKWTLFFLIAILILAGCTPAAPQEVAQTGGQSAGATATQPAAEALPTGETPNGGAPDGGTPNGGTPNGGTPNGGTPNGGTPSATEAQTGGETQPAENAEPIVVTRAITAEPSGLDPQGAAGAGQNVVLPYLFDTLVYRDVDNRYKPFLAETWETSTDGKQITFTLRKDVLFHDGSLFNAEAVKFTFDRLIEQGQKSVLASMVTSIESLEVVDEFTVRFNFVAPSSTFLSSISTPYAGIISPTAVETSGEGFAQQPVGTGPFKLETWEPGVAINLVKNPDYAWAPEVVTNPGAPYIDRLVIKIIPDVSQQVTAFQNGEVDVLFVNQPSHLAKLKADPNTELIETQLNSLIYLGFNYQKPPFDDLRVRQALSHAVNKEELVKTALGGIGEAVYSPLAPTLPGFAPVLKANELAYDPEKAKALLADAGFTQDGNGIWSKDGQPFALTLLTSTRPPNQALATVLQSQYKAIGVNVEIQQLESAAAQDAASEGKFDLLLWRYDWNDADVLRVYLSSDRIGRTNRTFYSNPELDELLNQAAQEMNDTQRNEMYLEAQKVIMRDAPWVPLYTPKDFMAVRKDLTGVIMGPMGRVIMTDAKK